MNIFALTLSLLANTCQAADSRNLFSSANLDLNINVARTQKEASNDEVALQQKANQLSMEFLKHVDFDPSKHIADLKSQLVSIEAASLLSRDKLHSLESISDVKAAMSNAHGEKYVHLANANLARLFRIKAQTATFDAWQNSGFSASKFMDLAKESILHFPDGRHCKRLADFGISWHLNTGKLLKMNEDDLGNAIYHTAQYSAVNFIYLGLLTLNSSDSAEFEKCIKAESFDGICALAKKIVTSNQYSRAALGEMRMMIDTEVAEGNRIAMLANGFSKVIHLAWDEEDLHNIKAKLISHGNHCDVESSVNYKSPKVIVNEYEQCISWAAVTVTKNLCVRRVQIIWNIKSLKSDLETLQSLFKKSERPTESEGSFMLRNVVEPAIILINSKRILRDFDRDGLSNQLQNRGIETSINSNDQALKVISAPKLEKTELSDRLFLVQKSLDYLRHIDDVAYVRKDFDEMINVFKNREKNSAFHLVNEVVQELKKSPNVQKCSFDLIRGKLMCKSAEMMECLIKILKTEFAGNILIEFCKSVISEQSLSKAITNFEILLDTHRIAYCSKYSGVDRLRPDYILFYHFF